jgi:hypothetical protein
MLGLDKSTLSAIVATLLGSGALAWADPDVPQSIAPAPAFTAPPGAGTI